MGQPHPLFLLASGGGARLSSVLNNGDEVDGVASFLDLFSGHLWNGLHWLSRCMRMFHESRSRNDFHSRLSWARPH